MTSRYFVEIMPNIRACTVVIETPKSGEHTPVKCGQHRIVVDDVELNIHPYMIDNTIDPKIQLRKGVTVFRFTLRTGKVKGDCTDFYQQGAGIDDNDDGSIEDAHAVVGSAFPQGSIYRGFATADKMRSLLPSHIRCRKCHSRVSCTEIVKVFPLPSEGWTELCDYISCSSNLNHLRNVEARPGTCLVGDTYILLHEKNINAAQIGMVVQDVQLIDTNVEDTQLNSSSHSHCEEKVTQGDANKDDGMSEVLASLTEPSVTSDTSTTVTCKRCLWTLGNSSTNTDDGGVIFCTQRVVPVCVRFLALFCVKNLLFHIFGFVRKINRTYSVPVSFACCGNFIS
eukprot:m.187800 g.187800  ORF g.187800 m.187800 type:complete len:340 (+) comp18510_c0_seq8:487-1506(+)